MATGQTLRRVHGARSETGYVRTANEDRMGWWRTSYGDVYVISDGMGGYRGGALAAELTVTTLQERLAAGSLDASDLPQLVRDAFLAANAAVFQSRRADDPETRDMGATGVALVAAAAHVLVGHVGDSRAYLWRRGQGLTQLTRDHTRVQKMLDAGLVTPEQAAVHPEASVLDRAIGHQPSVDVDVGEWIPLRAGDMVLLCSDGLCGYVDDAEIAGILKSRGDAQALADRLVDCALMKGGEDNVTVQLVCFGRRSGSSFAALLGKPPVLVPVAMVVSTAVTLLVTERGRQADGAALAQLTARVEAMQKQIQPGPAASAPPLPAVRASAPAVATSPSPSTLRGGELPSATGGSSIRTTAAQPAKSTSGASGSARAAAVRKPAGKASGASVTPAVAGKAGGRAASAPASAPAAAGGAASPPGPAAAATVAPNAAVTNVEAP